MLSSIKINNLAIIKELNLEFGRGLIVLTGETGAGKSIILDGINLLIGEKISVDMIRSDADSLVAEGVFEITEDTVEIMRKYEMEPEGKEIFVRREIDRNGKNKILLNDRRISQSSLGDIMDTVVDLVGQNTHQMLLNKKYHIKLVDSFLDDDGIKFKNEMNKLCNDIFEYREKLEKLAEIKREVKERRDLYEFQVRELSELALKRDEDNELEEEYQKLFNSGKILEQLNKAIFALKEGEKNVLSMIASAKASVEQAARYNNEYNNTVDKLENGYYQIEEGAYEIENYLSNFEIDDRRLEKVSARLDKIAKIKKKYSKSVNELIDYAIEIKKKLGLLEENEFEEDKILKEIKLIESKYYEVAKKISDKRRKIGNDIEYTLVKELFGLNMKNIQFKVVVFDKDEISREGIDNIEFMIATNVGEELKSLSKIVSGGEASRIMLSLKSIFSKADNIPVLIFDEIDTGIGGETLRKVALKLKEISDSVQVICITHSSQIAALADIHFYIEKKVDNDKTITVVKRLGEEERVAELTRMIAGDNATEIVKSHARELLKEGKKWNLRN